ncbi:MAG TPA: hypothetical protein VNM90_15240 [Haliangium sp.]|nr:hypothetical protein [Haliangium sp.]
MLDEQQEGTGSAGRGGREPGVGDQVVHPATAWHPLFYGLMDEGAPPGLEIRTEIVLSQQPRRADLLLLRREDMPRRDGEARVLRGLWPLLGPVTLAEFKAPKSGYRRRDLLRLIGYGVQYNELNMKDLAGPAELMLALLTPAETPSLRAAIDYMGWGLERLGNGYAQVAGAWYTTFVAFIDEVCEAERDDILRLFSRHRSQTVEGARWLNARCGSRNIMEKLRELEGYEDVMELLASMHTPEELLRYYDPEEVVKHLKPEERLAGLEPEEILRFLRHLGERGELEGKLPAVVLEALRKGTNGTP